MSKVVVFGTGDYARNAAYLLRQDSPHEVAAFTVHERFLDRPELLGLPVVPFESVVDTHPPGELTMLVAVGYSRVNQARAEVYRAAKELGYEFLTYVHPRATVAENVEIGENTFVFEENVIQPFVSIGNNTVLWSGNHIGHDTTVGDSVFIASHVVISGNCRIGDYCFVGVNATFRDGLTIAPRCVVGAGAVMMKNTSEGDVFAVRQTERFPKKSWELGL